MAGVVYPPPESPRGEDHIADIPKRAREALRPRVRWPLGHDLGQIRRAYRIGAEDIAQPDHSDLFIGGLTGRSGTTWLGQLLASGLEPGHVTVHEHGVFVLAQLRGAPYEYYQVARSDERTRRAYLSYIRGFFTRGPGYRRHRMYGTGLRGFSRHLPKRAIDLACDLLADDLEEVETLEDVYVAFGRFYSRIHTFYALMQAETLGWISREPGYGRHVAELYRMIPNARTVIMVRDGRDAIVSMTERGWAGGDLKRAVDRWRVFTQMTVDGVDRVPESNRLVMRYEDLATDFERNLDSILSFYGVADTDGVKQRILAQGAHRPRVGSIGRWRDVLPPEVDEYFRATCSEVMVRLGYDL